MFLDHNEAFTTGGKGLSDVMHGVGQQWPLIRFLLDDGLSRQVQGAPGGGGRWRLRRGGLRRAGEDPAPSALTCSRKKPWTNKSLDAAFEASVQRLINHANRRAAIASALGKATSPRSDADESQQSGAADTADPRTCLTLNYGGPLRNVNVGGGLSPWLDSRWGGVRVDAFPWRARRSSPSGLNRPSVCLTVAFGDAQPGW